MKNLVMCPKCKVTGWHGNAIDYWNEHIANLTIEELEK